MKCKRAKQSMALSVGRDLDEGSDHELQRHVSSCPPCRDYFGRLRESANALQQAGEDSCEPLSGQITLWPAVSRALRKPVRRPSPFTWSQAWVPVVAVASMVLAMISISNTMNTPHPDGSILVGPGASEATTAAVGVDSSTATLKSDDSKQDPAPKRPKRAKRD